MFIILRSIKSNQFYNKLPKLDVYTFCPIYFYDIDNIFDIELYTSSSIIKFVKSVFKARVTVDI